MSQNINLKQVGLLYLEYLENNNIEALLSLFSADAIVHSPIYGSKPAKEFYKILGSDTSNSSLTFINSFENYDTNSFALYFNYEWTLKNGKVVSFDVVDVIQCDAERKIKDLKIIYDTFLTRKEVDALD